jgi:long-chain fatty acid transport protein
MKITWLVALSLAAALISDSAAAQLGPALAGRSAAAQNAITVNQNPAGIMRLPKFQLATNTSLVVGLGKFDVDAGKSSESGGNPKNDPFFGAIPEFGLSMPIGDRFAVGLGFSIPSGFGSDFGNDWAGRYFADEFSLFFVSLQPVVAARVTDWLFLGAGAALMYSGSETKVNVRNGPGLEDGRLKLEIDGFAAGPVASILVLPTDDLRIGVTWRGEIDPGQICHQPEVGCRLVEEARLNALRDIQANLDLLVEEFEALEHPLPVGAEILELRSPLELRIDFSSPAHAKAKVIGR